MAGFVECGFRTVRVCIYRLCVRRMYHEKDWTTFDHVLVGCEELTMKLTPSQRFQRHRGGLPPFFCSPRHLSQQGEISSCCSCMFQSTAFVYFVCGTFAPVPPSLPPHRYSHQHHHDRKQTCSELSCTPYFFNEC